MSDDELVKAHDQTAQHTSVGVNFWLDEVSRRAFNRASTAALAEAERARKLAVVNMWVAIVAAAAALVAILVPIWTAPPAIQVRACDAVPPGGGEPAPALCVIGP